MDLTGDAVVEIACDESGFSGSNLLDAATPVFTHASVDLRVDEAADLIQTLRSGYRWSLNEVKSGQFLRSRQATAALSWLLAALEGRAHVHVVDKEFFLVTRIVHLFLAEPSYAAGIRLTEEHRRAAVTLYRAGPAGGPGWSGFLIAFVEMVRIKRRSQPDHRVVERFFQARDALAGTGPGAEAERVLSRISRSRVRAVVRRLGQDDRSIPPPLEPMLPALAETVLFWSGGQRRVLVIHDEQSALTADRLTRLQHVLTRAGSPQAALLQTRTLPASVSPLAGLVTVDSRDDPRVQVADLLAGIARRLSTDGDDDPLRPFVSAHSLRDPER